MKTEAKECNEFGFQMAYGFPVGIEDAHKNQWLEVCFLLEECVVRMLCDSIWVRCGNCGSNGCFLFEIHFQKLHELKN